MNARKMYNKIVLVFWEIVLIGLILKESIKFPASSAHFNRVSIPLGGYFCVRGGTEKK
jgi:hypothetical protein